MVVLFVAYVCKCSSSCIQEFVHVGAPRPDLQGGNHRLNPTPLLTYLKMCAHLHSARDSVMSLVKCDCVTSHPLNLLTKAPI
jgi:hypothetical protein